jgi:hypothetical protein
LDVVVAVGTERGDKEGGVIVKSVIPGDGEQEIFLDVFVLWAPDFLTSFVDDGVLVRVVGDSSDTRQGNE